MDTLKLSKKGYFDCRIVKLFKLGRAHRSLRQEPNRLTTVNPVILSGGQYYTTHYGWGHLGSRINKSCPISIDYK